MPSAFAYLKGFNETTGKSANLRASTCRPINGTEDALLALAVFAGRTDAGEFAKVGVDAAKRLKVMDKRHGAQSGFVGSSEAKSRSTRHAPDPADRLDATARAVLLDET